MKYLRCALTFLLALAATTALAQSPAQTSLSALKSLAGVWRGKDTLGHAARVSYRVTGNGSAVLSEMTEVETGEDMISMFHLDGDRLLLTHYCSAGNQPRMKATASPDGKTITFEFLDATNLVNPNSGHMHRVVFNLLAPDHHTEEWTFVENGKDTKNLFDLRRKKRAFRR